MTRPENISKDISDRLIQPWEEFWVTHQPYLLEHGYRLRARYDPNWVPSWRKPRWWTTKKLNPIDCPDSKFMGRAQIIDAIRVSDGTKVALKLVRLNKDIPILEYLSSPELLADPRNHTVPILDKILVPGAPNGAWIVMPVLLDFDHREFFFQFVSEIVEAIGQFLEGLEFMHEHRIAHRDACRLNLMVDSKKLIPNANFDFLRTYMKENWKSRIESVERRSVGPLMYYFIDFETACWYPPDEDNPLCTGLYGQEPDVPEMSETVPYNPFKLDVYQLGTVFLYLIKRYEGVDFLKPLQEAMMHIDPQQRPTAAEANQIFRDLLASFADADMSRRIWMSNLPPYLRYKLEFPTLRVRILRSIGFKCSVM